MFSISKCTEKRAAMMAACNHIPRPLQIARMVAVENRYPVVKNRSTVVSKKNNKSLPKASSSGQCETIRNKPNITAWSAISNNQTASRFRISKAFGTQPWA